MRTLQQSSQIRELWSKQVGQKVSENRQEAEKIAHDLLGMGFLGGLVFDVKQLKNQVQGNIGETSISLLLKMLPDSWIMFNNALIPTSTGKLTEIDCLIIGTAGIFLLEIKTWQGSFSAYKDRWKRREGTKWIGIDNSPTTQNVYHQKMFQQWITNLIPNFNTDLIFAPVVFTLAQWIGTNECSVPVFHGFGSLLDFLLKSPNYLTPNQVNDIGELIKNCSLNQGVKPLSKPVKPPSKPVVKPILKPKKFD